MVQHDDLTKNSHSLSQFPAVPRSLRDICRRALRYELGPAQMPAVRDLRLPPKLQDYLLFQERPENPFALLPVYRPMLGEGPL